MAVCFKRIQSLTDPTLNEAIDIHVPCGTWSRIDAKDQMSDVLNDVTFSVAVYGFCEQQERQFAYEIWE